MMTLPFSLLEVVMTKDKVAVLNSLSDADLNNVRLAAEVDKTKPGVVAVIAEIKKIQAARRAAKGAKAGADLLGKLL